MKELWGPDCALMVFLVLICRSALAATDERPAFHTLEQSGDHVYLARYAEASDASVRKSSEAVLVNLANTGAAVQFIEDAKIAPGGGLIAVATSDHPAVPRPRIVTQTLFIIEVSASRVVYRMQRQDYMFPGWFRWRGNNTLEYLRWIPEKDPKKAWQMELVAVSSPQWQGSEKRLSQHPTDSHGEIMPMPPDDRERFTKAARTLEERRRTRYVAPSQAGSFSYHMMGGRWAAVSNDGSAIAALVLVRHSTRSALILMQARNNWDVQEVIADVDQRQVDHLWLCGERLVVRIGDPGKTHQIRLYDLRDLSKTQTMPGELLLCIP